MGKWKEKAKQLEAKVAELEKLLEGRKLQVEVMAKEVDGLADQGRKLEARGERLQKRSDQLDAAVAELSEGAQEMVDANDALKPFKAMVEWLQEHKADLYAPQKGAQHWSTITGYGSGRVITKGATAEEALRNSMERSDK